MNSRTLLTQTLLAIAVLFVLQPRSEAATKPNFVYILCDDLGYGDVACLNPSGKIKTPNMDRLAREGMMFTDAHSGSAVCTPTRYGIITGRYAWRSRLKNGVLGGLSPHLIEPSRLTVAGFLKQQGYHTAAIGKWHLGMDWVIKPGKDVSESTIESREQVWNVDYSKPVKNGPTRVGFDYFFGISASLDMVPYTYILNDRVTALPTEDRDFPLMLGREKGRCRQGPTAPGFQVEDVLPMFTRKAVEYIGQRAGDAKQGKPFFLYLPLNGPHTPIAPTKEWQGRSGLNPYGDFVMQVDWTIGQVLKALDQHGLSQNTLLIMTSDNGCSPSAKFDELVPKGHNPSHVFRGWKADIFEGGHHVAFLARWPGKVKPSSQCADTICLTDFFATCADILGQKLPDNAGVDSVSILPDLLGTAKGPVREATVHHSINGSFSLRQGNWKLELCPDSGGWSEPRPGTKQAVGLPPVQLYDLSQDLGEKHNVQDQYPEVVKRLTALVQKYVEDGRSTPGKPQQNEGETTLHRKPTPPKKAAKNKGK